ncbi:MAG TPA: PhoU domain-containing protein, partial [Peptostreptococcaceae bacterium]|nr:PhoU domain-containing protein [Peptostreptococcaceae bacterium]
GLFEKSTDKVNKTFELEKLVNQLQKDLLNYLLKLSKTPLSENAREIVDELFNTVNDIERIGDHAENIAELAQFVIEKDVNLSEKGVEELKDLYNKVISTYKYSLESMKNGDVDLAYRVVKMEEQVDLMERSCRTNHMYRLNNNLCSVDSGVIFLDLISNLERVSDHSVNIAQQVIKAGSLIKK